MQLQVSRHAFSSHIGVLIRKSLGSFPVVQFRRLLFHLQVFVLVLAIVCILVNIFQCVPVDAFWNTLAGELSEKLGGRCIDIFAFFLAAGAINALSDFVLLALVRVHWAPLLEYKVLTITLASLYH